MNKRKPKKQLLPAEAGIPRFVVSITDTQTVVGGKYFSINVGADRLEDFTRLIPKRKRTSSERTELQHMFRVFRDAIEAFDNEPYDAQRVGEDASQG